MRSVKEAFEEYLSLNPRLSKDVVYTIITNEDAALLCDYIPANLLLKYTDKQALLNEGTVSGRLEKLLEILRRETKILHIEKDIQSKVNEQMDKNQRDYYLREQMRAISNELDDFDDTREEAEEYKAKIEKTKTARRGAGETAQGSGPHVQNAGQFPGGFGHPHLSGHMSGSSVGYAYRG